ncbi:hypothetical protein AcW2_006593 [Taiwanofungus camphoratus]|nr:hypothetical protein AcW2_006593 [Antrodia cinnamomea]
MLRHTDADMEVARKIASGQVARRVVSHQGRSQYSRIGGGVSACGLAALNCARIVLGMERNGLRNEHLVREMMKRETLEEVLRPCLSWSSPAHLDVEDIHKAPIFMKSLKLDSSDYGQSGLEHFRRVLARLADASRSMCCSICAIITRPPEIVTCVKLAANSSDVFIVFDSHPRPNDHPHGAAFIFLNSLDSTARYLAGLLRYDDRLLMDSTLQWQAQLLAHFSAHIFSVRPNFGSPIELEEATLGASLEVLSLRARVLELESQNKTLASENDHLLEEVSRLEDEVVELDQERRRRAKSKNDCSHSLNRAHDCDSTNKPHGSSKDHDLRPEDYRTITAILQIQLDEAMNTDAVIATAQQREFNEEDSRLGKVLRDLRATAPTLFECGICFERFNEDVVANLKPCNHRFCRICIREYAALRIEEHRYPIVCPSCMPDEVRKDTGVLDDSFIQQLGLSEKQYEIFIEMQMAAFSITLHCRRCKNSVFVDRKEYEQTELIVCPLQGCSYAWCKACSQQIDIGGPQHSCDGSSELRHLMNERGWKYCPGCQTPAEKIEGCNHMTCMSPGCNTHFCYVCGEFITQSIRRQEIETALSAHYNRCRLFENVADRRSARKPRPSERNPLSMHLLYKSPNRTHNLPTR